MKQWSEKEVEYLREAITAGDRPRSIAFALNKSTKAVNVKIYRLGLSRPNVPWPSGILNRTLELIKAGRSVEFIRKTIEAEFSVSKRTSLSVFNLVNKKPL